MTNEEEEVGAIALNRGVDIAFTAAEVNDLIQFALYLCAAHAQDCSVHEDILSSRHLTMETRANFQEGANSTMRPNRARGRTGDAGE